MVLTFKLLADQNDSHEELDRKRGLNQPITPRQVEAVKGDQHANGMLPQESARSNVKPPPRSKTPVPPQVPRP